MVNLKPILHKVVLIMWIPIDKHSNVSLIQQIYERIREMILSGELKGEERLPSSRKLAETLNVSRTIILEVYDQLIAEGYVKTKTGSGTFVEPGITLGQFPLLDKGILTKKPSQNIQSKKEHIIDFRSGVPALNEFPRKKWAQVAKTVYENIDESLLGYSLPEGSKELRNTLSDYLYKTRGIKCNPNQIIITSGATQAINIVAKLLIKPGGELIIEDPVTKEIREIFMERGASIIPISVDDLGMKTELLSGNQDPSFVFVTPSHQFPLGGTLPIQRRLQLIQFATKTNCFIVEDDYDSEFRYAGSPVSSIQGLLPERVIYIGTFSKILSPSLRIAYLILPLSLVEKGKMLKRYTDYHSPTMEQLVLARFIEQGYLDKHITKMRKIYRTKREVLINCITKEFGEQVKVKGHSTGIHLIVEFDSVSFTNEIVNKIEKHGVKIYPVDNHSFLKGTHQNKLIIGYGNLSVEDIAEGIRRLKKGIASVLV